MIDDFFVKKTKCDSCPLTLSIKKKKKIKLVSKQNDYRIKTDLRNTKNCDILILTDTIERLEDLEKLQKLLKINNVKNYVIAPAISCRTASYELPDPLYSTYAYCDKFDITKYNPKVVLTTGKALYYFTKSSVFSSWREFAEIVFNETYFYPHIDFKEWKGRIYPIGFLPDVFASDTFENYHFKKQVEFIKNYLDNFEKEKITVDDINNYKIEVVEDLPLFLKRTDRYKKVAIDTETNSLNVFIDGFEVGCVQVSFDGITAYYIPFRLIENNKKEFSEWLDKKYQILANGKYDGKALNRLGISTCHTDEDIPLIFHLMNTIRESNSIKVLAWLIGFGGYEDELDSYKKKYNIKNYLEIPNHIMKKYAGLDAIVTYRLYQFLHKYLVPRQQDTYKLYRENIIPVIPVFQKMEENGILVDKKYVENYHNQLMIKKANVEEEIYKIVGRNFNIASNDELGKVLEEMGLPDYGRTKKGIYKTGIELLVQWDQAGYEIAKKLVEYRKISKLDSSFVGESKTVEVNEDFALFSSMDKEEDDSGLYQHIMPDGKIHGTIMPALTSSWRGRALSPNMQNQPKQGSEGKAFRKVYVAPEDFYFCEADYSGFQLRLMGIYSNDESMIKAFNGKDADLHSKTANSIFCSKISFEDFLNNKKEKPYKDYRQKGKGINLAFSFGQSAYSFQKIIRDNWTEEHKDEYLKENNLKLKKDDSKDLFIAEDIHKKFFIEYEGLPIYFDDMREFAQKNGYVDCPIFPGLRRHIPEMLQISSNLSKEKLSHYSTLHNVAINTGAQGGEALIVYRAIRKIQKEIDKNKLKSMLVGTVHDSIVLYIHKQEIKQMYYILKEAMEIFDYSIPILNEIEIGKIWGFSPEIEDFMIKEWDTNKIINYIEG